LVDVEVVGGTVVAGEADGRAVVGVVVLGSTVFGVEVVGAECVGSVEEGADGWEVVVVGEVAPARPEVPTAGVGTETGAAEAVVAIVGQTTAPTTAVRRSASSPDRSLGPRGPRSGGVGAPAARPQWSTMFSSPPRALP
jgi:hypothetical protein